MPSVSFISAIALLNHWQVIERPLICLGGLHFIPDGLERNNMLAGLLLGGFFDLWRQFEARQDRIDTVKSD